MTIASDIDLRHPLVMDYDRFVVAAPRYANQLACIHGVGGSGPRCGSLARADTEDWMTLSRGLVEVLVRPRDPERSALVVLSELHRFSQPSVVRPEPSVGSPAVSEIRGRAP